MLQMNKFFLQYTFIFIYMVVMLILYFTDQCLHVKMHQDFDCLWAQLDGPALIATCT